MHVRVNYGPNVGQIVEFPYHVGLSIVEAGRGVRVDPNAPELPAVAVAAPGVQHRDPDLPAADRRGRKKGK